MKEVRLQYHRDTGIDIHRRLQGSIDADILDYILHLEEKVEKYIDLAHKIEHIHKMHGKDKDS